MNSRMSANHPVSLAARVAPEDLQRGDYVGVLSVTHEYPSFYWSGECLGLPPREPVRVECLPVGGESLPLKVEEICLPFVFVKPPRGDAFTLDVRQLRLARVSRRYAVRVWRVVRQRSNPDQC